MLLPYSGQRPSWPASGRHILAQHDADTVVVYQAYRPEIGLYAAAHQRFGGSGFGRSRMTWIKPNFLWMMYRSAWGTSEGQTVVLAITLRRSAFEEILRRAVPSTFWPERFATRDEYERALETSDVRLQWDPDHDPSGTPQERRAIQLGLRGETGRAYAAGTSGPYVLEIADVSALVAEQREKRGTPALMTPAEDVVRLDDPALARSLRLDA